MPSYTSALTTSIVEWRYQNIRVLTGYSLIMAALVKPVF